MTRSADDVGRGLAPARAARPIWPAERIHVVGVAGAGASAAALLAARAGARVSGCDPGAPSPYTAALDALEIPIAALHDAAHLRHPGEAGAAVDRLAVTKALTAIAPDHPELEAARALSIPIEPWQQVVADAAVTREARLIGVAGTHGKSTSSGWLLHVLASAGRDPSGFVGALLPAALSGGIPATARWGSGPEFVVEADEYAGNFDAFRPSVAILLNAEWDHPDVFADENAVRASFEAWIRASDGAGERPALVANVGDPGAAAVAARLADWGGRVVKVSLVDAPAPEALEAERRRLAAADGATDRSTTAVVGRIEEAAGDRTVIAVLGLEAWATTRLTISLAGRHNAQNGLAVAAAARVVGLSVPEIVDGLASFQGVGRRLELKGEPGGVAVLDDYAHHPTAIRETLRAVRQRYPGRPVWAVYEPLTYHRTAALLDSFAEVLAHEAEHVVIADIWAGRDLDTSVASAEALAAAVRARGASSAVAAGDADDTAAYLARSVLPGDVVLVMGGGRSYRIAARLVEMLSR